MILSGILACLSPGTLYRFAKYPSKESLVVGWGIYGLAAGIVLALNNLDIDEEESDKIVPGTLLGAFVLSMFWAMFSGLCGNKWCPYVIGAVVFNLLGIAETSYYLVDSKTFVKV